MTEPTAMYGMDAYWAMRTNDAMGEFEEALANLEPEIRVRFEASLRRRYSAASNLGDWARQQREQQMAMAQRANSVMGSGLVSVLGNGVWDR